MGLNVQRFIKKIPLEGSSFNVRTIEDLDRALVYKVNMAGELGCAISLRHLVLSHARKAKLLGTSVLQQLVELNNKGEVCLYTSPSSKTFVFSVELLGLIVADLRESLLADSVQNENEQDLEACIEIKLPAQLLLVTENSNPTE